MSNVDRTSGGARDRESGSDTRGRPVVRTIDGAGGRTVFTESGNTDAWIATDRVSDVQR